MSRRLGEPFAGAGPLRGRSRVVPSPPGCVVQRVTDPSDVHVPGHPPAHRRAPAHPGKAGSTRSCREGGSDGEASVGRWHHPTGGPKSGNRNCDREVMFGGASMMACRRPGSACSSRRRAGYCAGVERAVEAVERALAKHGAPVYVRKQIVHNLHVVHDLEAMGAVFVEELDEVPEGAVAVLSAHGSPPDGVRRGERTRPRADRRDLSAGDQGARRGAPLRRRRSDDRPDRPRRARGGRGHERPGAGAHRAGADLEDARRAWSSSRRTGRSPT